MSGAARRRPGADGMKVPGSQRGHRGSHPPVSRRVDVLDGPGSFMTAAACRCLARCLAPGGTSPSQPSVPEARARGDVPEVAWHLEFDLGHRRPDPAGAWHREGHRPHGRPSLSTARGDVPEVPGIVTVTWAPKTRPEPVPGTERDIAPLAIRH